MVYGAVIGYYATGIWDTPGDRLYRVPSEVERMGMTDIHIVPRSVFHPSRCVDRCRRRQLE